VPIFDETAYPTPTPELLLHADWPKRKTILGRGILALQMKCGAEDPADGRRATVATIAHADRPREYHHLFPASLLEEAELPSDEIFRSLNCALITWRTNRTLSNKDPVQYLRERADNMALGNDELKRRLGTHLIPYDKLAVGYAGIADELRAYRVSEDYREFLATRARIVSLAAQKACAGEPLIADGLIHDGA